MITEIEKYNDYLNPCPVCGNMAKIISVDYQKNDIKFKQYYVKCNKCNTRSKLTLSYSFVDKIYLPLDYILLNVVSNWNNRVVMLKYNNLALNNCKNKLVMLYNKDYHR